MCSTSEGKVLSLMDFIYQYQRAKFLKKDNPLEEHSKAERNFIIDQKDFDLAKYIEDEQNGKHDSEFVDIGDWSICDHVCGGGQQFKYKGCKPPLAGHKCNKKPIKLKKACNTQPCKPGENGGKVDVPDDAWK
jgi:hypothetical protein